MDQGELRLDDGELRIEKSEMRQESCLLRIDNQDLKILPCYTHIYYKLLWSSFVAIHAVLRTFKKSDISASFSFQSQLKLVFVPAQPQLVFYYAKDGETS